MRVGVNTLFLIPDEVGGAEVYVRGVLPRLCALDPSLELVLFTNRENHETFAEFDRIPLHVPARCRPWRVLAEQTMLVAAARRAHLDLLFSPGYTAPLRAPCPQVVAILDTQFCEHPEDFPWLSLQAQKFLITRAARVADVITTLSEFCRGQIEMHLKVPSQKIIVSPLAPAPAFSGPQPCRLQKPFLLFVSNTYLHKNGARLARAFLNIAHKVPHDLVIVGQSRAGEPPPNPRIKRFFHLLHAGPELVGLFQGCDLFVFPSLYEGFGLPVVEAMAAGARVVAARAASIPEVAGDAATYFDPTSEEAIGRAILDVLDEPPKTRQRFIEIGRARARQFTWDRCARQTLAAFDQALQGSV